jgi:hypothetical protein
MHVVSLSVKNKNYVPEQSCFGKLIVLEREKLNRELRQQCKEETRLLNCSFGR